MSSAIDDDISFDVLAEQARQANNIVAQARGAMLAPELKKIPPTFATSQIMAMTGLDKGKFDYQIKRGDLPAGTLRGIGGRREFTLEEALDWVRFARSSQLRPRGARAATITIGNFKGGVTKTTTALTLAQGLSLRGHRVLVIDCDPQGSLTTLFGVLPDTEVQESDTILPLLKTDVTSLRSAVTTTYWSGIDLVAAAPVLFSAEILVAAQHATIPNYEYWRLINDGIEDLRDVYDVIVLDTPPSLGYVTLNALMASDGIVMPLPPSAMDFASSAQFWLQFTDAAKLMPAETVEKKRFSFVSVLPTKVEATDQSCTAVMQWMGAAYPGRLLPVEIPKSAAMTSATVSFGTIFDSAAGNTKTVKRAADAYERVIELVEDNVQAFWTKQLRRKGER
jgi:chromosome partitioning protein